MSLNFNYRLSIAYLMTFVVSLFLLILTRFEVFSLFAVTSLILARIECIFDYLKDKERGKSK